MTHYLIQPSDQIFVKCYGFLSFARNMPRKIGKNINKNLSSKNSQELLDHTKQSATHALKTASKRLKKQQKQLVILSGNKIANKITTKSPQNTSDTVTVENIETEIAKERYISPEKRQHSIAELR